MNFSSFLKFYIGKFNFYKKKKKKEKKGRTQCEIEAKAKGMVIRQSALVIEKERSLKMALPHLGKDQQILHVSDGSFHN